MVGDTTLKVDLSQVTLSYDVDDMIKEIDSKCDHIMKMINFQHHVKEKFKGAWFEKSRNKNDALELSDIVLIQPSYKQTIVKITACPQVVSCCV